MSTIVVRQTFGALTNREVIPNLTPAFSNLVYIKFAIIEADKTKTGLSQYITQTISLMFVSLMYTIVYIHTFYKNQIDFAEVLLFLIFHKKVKCVPNVL